MKKYSTLAFIAVAFIAISGNATAAIIFQTQNYSNVTTGSSLTWQKFDLNLGTLTAITLDISGALSGSFLVTNSDPTAITVYDSQGRIRLTFQGAGAPVALNGAYLKPLSTSPSTDSTGTTIPALSNQTFTLTGANTLPSISSNQFANAAYYSALGGGTFDTTMIRTFNVTVDGSIFNVDGSPVVAGGKIDLTYTYTPSSPVPEPGTWAAAAMLFGGAGFMRWRKRRS